MCLLAFASSIAAAEQPEWHRLDAQELANERVLRPRAADLIEQGEEAFRKDEFERAANLFREARQVSPHGALAHRRECQALTALGRRDEAIQACRRAVSNQGSGMDLRALVGALVSAPPTSSELAEALGLADRAREVMSQEPWGYAAQCDIARRLGDPVMLNHCLEELRRVAPNHDETQRVAAIARSTQHGWRYAFGWAALFLVFFGTAGDALKRALRGARDAAIAALIGAAIFALSRPVGAVDAPEERSATAGKLSQWPIDDADPMASVPTAAQRDANPLEYGYFLMDLSDRADQASKRGDHAAAARYWLALAKAVPDRSTGYSKACDSYEALGDWEKALATCKTALYKSGVLVKDYARFFTLVLQKKGSLELSEIQDLDKILQHLRKMDAGRSVADELNCDLGVRIGSVERLEQCTAAVAATAPGHPRTIYFQWTLALQRGNYDDARRSIERAKAAGTSPERIQQMEKATTAATSVWQRMKRRWPFAGGGILVALVGITLTLRASRRRSVVQPAQG